MSGSGSDGVVEASVSAASMFSPLALTGALPFLPLAQGSIDYEVDRRADPSTIRKALSHPRAQVMLVKDALVAVPRGQGVLVRRESARVRAALLPATYVRGELARIDDAFLAFLGVEHGPSHSALPEHGAGAVSASSHPERSAEDAPSSRHPERSAEDAESKDLAPDSDQTSAQGAGASAPVDDGFPPDETPYLALILPDRKYRSRRAAQGDASDAGTDQTAESAGDSTSLGAAAPIVGNADHADACPGESQRSTNAGAGAGAKTNANAGAGYATINHPSDKTMLDRLAERFDWADLRDFAPKASPRDAGLATSAVALSNWQHGQLFCPRCGAPTVPSGSGWTQRCTAFDAGGSAADTRGDAASAEAAGAGAGGHLLFPRVEPAVITLVVDAHDRLLIQHNKAWRNPLLHSVSAGFVEAGENLEHAVRRETMEETGVELGEVRYLGSQPWPFPGSLMVAFKAQARTTDIHVDGEEVASARWVTREELTRLIAMGEVEMPGKAAIARYMIEQWYGMEL